MLVGLADLEVQNTGLLGLTLCKTETQMPAKDVYHETVRIALENEH